MTQFDELAKSLSRGDVLKTLGVAVVGLLIPRSAEARKRRRGKRRGKLIGPPLPTPKLWCPPRQPAMLPICDGTNGCCRLCSTCFGCCADFATCRCLEGNLCFSIDLRCCQSQAPGCGTKQDCVKQCGSLENCTCHEAVDGSPWCALVHPTSPRCETNAECASGACIKPNEECSLVMTDNLCADEGARPLA